MAKKSKRRDRRIHDQSKVGCACYSCYNKSDKGKARNKRVREKRRDNPEYAEYRAKKLVWDRRNHFFRYGKLLDELTPRRPWLKNRYSARQLLKRMTGFDVESASFVDFSQPTKGPNKPVKQLGVKELFEQITGYKVTRPAKHDPAGA